MRTCIGISVAIHIAVMLWLVLAPGAKTFGPANAEAILVDLVPPHDIHAEQGGPTRSAAMILRSQRLGEGTVLQHQYDPKAKTITERYGPTQIPFELTVDAA